MLAAPMNVALAGAAPDWPMPPFFAVQPDGRPTGPESCQVLLRDGGYVSGTLVRFSPAQASLDILPEGAESAGTLGFARIKCVRIPRRLRFRRQASPLEARASELFHPSERQRYCLEFTGNEVMEGETAGYVEDRHGLYLFVPEEDGGIVRHFYPRSALRRHRIGPPVGEILVEENRASRADVEAAAARQHELRSQRIGDFLAHNHVVSRDQLVLAIRHQEGKPVLRLGEALMQLDLISGEQLEAALERHHRNRSTPLGRILIEMGVVDESVLKDVLARKLGIPFVGLARFNFDREAVRLVAAGDARKRGAIPLCLHEGALVVAFEDPLDTKALDEVRFLTQKRVIPAMATRAEIRQAISEQYATDGSAREEVPVVEPFEGDYEFHFSAGSETAGAGRDGPASSPEEEDEALAFVNATAAQTDDPVAQLVNRIILEAVSGGATGIHLETHPGEKGVRVRLRKDGILVDCLEVPAASRDPLVARIKEMARLDNAERGRPREGKLDLRRLGLGEGVWRVAAIPNSHGLEDVVLSSLAAPRPMAIDEMGLAPRTLASLNRLMERTSGLVLVCGPAGSGKTTALYYLLGSINTPGRSIRTAEDPVEVVQEGLRQVEVGGRTGLTFAAALRSFLHADPDVLMASDLRDAETARACIEASLSGCLVLSAMGSASASEGVLRLLDLGVSRFSVADALGGVLCLRLAKALCPGCRQPFEPEPAELEELAAQYCDGTGEDAKATLRGWRDERADRGGIALYRAVGCPHCNGTGYRGHVGIQELLVMTPELRRLVLAGAPLPELTRAAVAGGMRTLMQDGIAKVVAGCTDIGKLRAACP